jgi:hypothetical protein
MSDFETAVRDQFPFRPTGKDWERLLRVVEDMELRKQQPGSSRDKIAALINPDTLIYMAMQRAAEVFPDDHDPLRFPACDAWSEGWFFGVLFYNLGGTAGQHENLAGSLTNERMRAGRGAVILSKNGIRTLPDNPDSRRMMTVLDELDERIQNGESTSTIFNEIVDFYALSYLAVNRIAMTFPGLSAEQITDLVGAWTEGFLYGVLYERLPA